MSDRKIMLGIFLKDSGILVHIVLSVVAAVVAITTLTWEVLFLVPLGWCSYVIQEHLVHRFIFHAPLPRNQFLFNLLYRLHVGHHDQIHNSRLLFTPLWFSLPLGIVNFLIVSLVMPINYAFVFVYGGAVTAYVLFEWCHLLTHFHSTKRSKHVLKMTQDHGRHHHININHWFTVSPGGQLVDTVLGANPASIARSKFPRTCGLLPNDSRMINARGKFGEESLLANRAYPNNGSLA